MMKERPDRSLVYYIDGQRSNERTVTDDHRSDGIFLRPADRILRVAHRGIFEKARVIVVWLRFGRQIQVCGVGS
jgi:hypothetical protein